MNTSRNKVWTIYFLMDPRDWEIRYVGCSTQLRARLITHLSEARTRGKSPKCQWIRELMAAGLRPILIPFLKTRSMWMRDRLEEVWIRRMSLAGCNLLTTSGRERLIADGVIKPHEHRRDGKIESYYTEKAGFGVEDR